MDIIDTDDLYFRPDDAISAEDLKPCWSMPTTEHESGEKGFRRFRSRSIYDIGAIGYIRLHLNEIFKTVCDDAKISSIAWAGIIVKGFLTDDFGDDTAPDLTAPAIVQPPSLFQLAGMGA